jgi:glucosamine--fructose-6-phosphate aminotransferase (isomerizing)
MARRAGALTAALVNADDSPLAAACEFVLPIGAGPELSIAATKSCRDARRIAAACRIMGR